MYIPFRTRLHTKMILYTAFVLTFVAGVLGSCQRGWFQFGNSCYFFSSSRKTWTEAASFCWSFHAKLATVESQAENDFLTDFLTRLKEGITKREFYEYKDQNFWLGGTNEVTPGLWEWIPDGTPFSYTNWAQGEPNNYDRPEHCVEIVQQANHVGEWNSGSCSAQAHFICEKRHHASGETILG